MRVIKEMQLEEWIIPKALLLSEFNNSSEMTKGEITMRTFAKEVTRDTSFQVVDGEWPITLF